MRIASLILVALGVYLLVHAAYDEYRGATHMPLRLIRLRGSRSNSAYLYRIVVRQNQNPELFRRFMTTHWIYASLIEGVGVALYLTNKPPKNVESPP